MKRLRRLVHLAVVWLGVGLLAVDPAAACRLRNRCCPCYCAPAVVCCADGPLAPTLSDDRAPANSLPASPVPDHSPAPPPAAEPAANPPPPPPPQSAPVTRGEATPPLPGVAVQPEAATDASPPPSSIGSQRSRLPELPLTVPPPAATSPLRPLAEPNLGRSTQADTPVAPAAPPKPRTAPVTEPVPAPSGLTSPGIEPTVPTPAQPPAPAAPVDSGGAAVPPARPSARRSGDPPAPVFAAPRAASPRTPASPAPSGSTGPVAKPAFPPADDDPFAPRQPTPKVNPAETDDPFAPLAPPASTRPVAPAKPKAASPIAVERSAPKTDALLPGADGRLPIRDWNDSTGQFRVKARLVLILPGKVRLLKETGRTTTVPIERLSAADQAYVAEVVARYGSDLTKLDQLAAR